MNPGLLLDGVIAVMLLWLATAALSGRGLFRSIVLFIAFGMVLSLAWVRLGAPDVALAEAAIGAGLTGALLLATWGGLSRQRNRRNQSHPPERLPDSRKTGFLPPAALALLLAAVTGGLALALLHGSPDPGLSTIVQANLDASGSENPVTAVLLNFRGYDTLLEIAVLTAALAGVWALEPRRHLEAPSASPVLGGLVTVLTPLAAMICAYLLWAGASRPGGAFQAGAVLASIGVLFILAGRWRARWTDAPMRWGSVVGLAGFLAIALGVMVTGGQFLEYPPVLAGGLILAVEAAAAASIAVILIGLFIGGPPADRP